MSEFKDKLVRELLRKDGKKLSRNRNFELFEDPIVAEARRMSRYLDSVTGQIMNLNTEDLVYFEIDHQPGRKLIHWCLKTPTHESSISSYFSEKEWDFLSENKLLMDRLNQLAALFEDTDKDEV